MLRILLPAALLPSQDPSIPMESLLDARVLASPTWTVTRVRGGSNKRALCIGLTFCIANSRNCCSGQFSTPQTCPRSGVQYYDYFSTSGRVILTGGIVTELCACREQMPQLVCLCLRRVQRDRFVDLRATAEQRLYHHFLPLNSVTYHANTKMYTKQLLLQFATGCQCIPNREWKLF